MKFLPTNTLAFHNAAPQVHLHDLSHLPTALFGASTLKFRKDCGLSTPHEDAVSFYTLNHAASLIRKSFTENEPLPAWAVTVMDTYTAVALRQGERMLHYILCITTREMRHLKSSTAAFWKKVEDQFGPKGVAVLKNISSDGNENTAMDKYTKTPPDMSIGEYTKVLAFAFHHGTWGGSYGGQPWGNITDSAVSYLTGATSMEMLVDTGYTLAHNTAPIFNKGMMYSHNDQTLLTALDLQRAGQMLEAMLETTAHVSKPADAMQAASLIKTHLPREIKGYVDWKLVDDLRPDQQANPGKYAKLVAAQQQPTAPKVKAKVKKQPDVLTTLLGKPVKVVGTWQVFPHQVVTVVERVGN